MFFFNPSFWSDFWNRPGIRRPGPLWQYTTKPVSGCVCPPGANKECERDDCPRKSKKDKTNEPR